MTEKKHVDVTLTKVASFNAGSLAQTRKKIKIVAPKWGKFGVAQTKNLFCLTIRLVQLSLH